MSSLRNLAITFEETFVLQFDCSALSEASVDFSSRDDVGCAASEIGRAWAVNSSIQRYAAKAPNRELTELDDVCIIVLKI